MSVHNMSVYEGSCGVGCDILSSLVLSCNAFFQRLAAVLHRALKLKSSA